MCCSPRGLAFQNGDISEQLDNYTSGIAVCADPYHDNENIQWVMCLRLQRHTVCVPDMLHRFSPLSVIGHGCQLSFKGARLEHMPTFFSHAHLR